jgi:mannitol/fructose-specific phosphotransferase system IIA component (Ntr-type)
MRNEPPFDSAATTLADYTKVSLMAPSLHERDPVGVIQELCRLLQPALEITDMLPFYNAALNREFLDSTATDFGVAFPHARISGNQPLCFALGRSQVPFCWGGKGAPTVQLVFLLAVPASETISYLKVQAALAKFGGQTHGRQELLAAKEAGEMFGVLNSMMISSLLQGHGTGVRPT